MKKIPTLFKRIYKDHKVIGITQEVTEGCEPVLQGIAIPTVKYDGCCCAVISGNLYKRYDAKKGKKPPVGAIPCQESPDPVTGHWPHWVKCVHNNPSDRWFFKAFLSTPYYQLPSSTYEAIGPHFQGNPYNLKFDTLIGHGQSVINQPLDNYEDIRKYLQEHAIEGIVYWYNGSPLCKIKRSDFGFKWPVTQRELDEDGDTHE